MGLGTLPAEKTAASQLAAIIKVILFQEKFPDLLGRKRNSNDRRNERT